MSRLEIAFRLFFKTLAIMSQSHRREQTKIKFLTEEQGKLKCYYIVSIKNILHSFNSNPLLIPCLKKFRCPVYFSKNCSKKIVVRIMKPN